MFWIDVMILNFLQQRISKIYAYSGYFYEKVFLLVCWHKFRFYIKMEGNRDESERCYYLANKYLSQGDLEKAKKFLNKAERLYPTQRAKGILLILYGETQS